MQQSRLYNSSQHENGYHVTRSWDTNDNGGWRATRIYGEITPLSQTNLPLD